MTRLWLSAALLVLGCGGEVDPGSGGAAACNGPHWRRLPTPPGAGHRGLHHAAAWGSDQIEIWSGMDGNPEPGASRPLVSGWHVRSDGELVAIPTAGAPSPRSAEAVGVLDNRLFVWGGGDADGGFLGDGSQLDLVTSAWSPMSAQGQLAPRHSPVAGVAGNSFLVWGGYGGDATGKPSGVFGDGAFYDPEAGGWEKLDGEPLELRVGPYQIVVAQADEHVAVLAESTATARLYYFLPDEKRWFAASTAGAPSSRSGAIMAYLAATRELLVWGGYGEGVANDGARYSFLTDSWKPVSSEGAPSARVLAYGAALRAQGAGTRAVVWGGETADQFDPTNTGGIYDAATDTWAALPLDECSPPPLNGATFTAFGNGRQALLWGGTSPGEPSMPEQN